MFEVPGLGAKLRISLRPFLTSKLSLYSHALTQYSDSSKQGTKGVRLFELTSILRHACSGAWRTTSPRLHSTTPNSLLALMPNVIIGSLHTFYMCMSS